MGAATSILTTDFAQGALVVLGAVAAHFIWKFINVPSIESIESTATKAIPHMGDGDDEVTLYGFQKGETHRAWRDGVTDGSPFVSRVEAYLRLAKIPYVKRMSAGGRENPRGKVPFANIKGVMVDDSCRIIETIKNTFSVTIDDALTEEQHATGYMVQQMLFGSLYWVELHQAFNTHEGRKWFQEEISHAPIPALFKYMIVTLVIRSQNDNLFGCGWGRLPSADIVKRGQRDLRVLNTVLGKHDFLLATETPTSYDCNVYAFLVNLFYDPPQTACPWVKDIQEELPNLVKYVVRMREILYPELTK